MSKESVVQLRVRYYETDQMGVVHHSNYIRWFEMGRTELLRSLGSSYKAVEAAGLMLPVIQVSSSYLKPALYDDLIEIITRVRAYTGVKMIFAYELIKTCLLRSLGELREYTGEQLIANRYDKYKRIGEFSSIDDSTD